MTKIDALRIAINDLRTIDATDSNIIPNAPEAIEILEKMVAQLSKPRNMSDEAKAKANAKRKAATASARAALMEKVLPVVRDAIGNGGTAKEIYERCASNLPNDFTANKVQYILLHELADEIVKVEQKGKPNVYQMKEGI